MSGLTFFDVNFQLHKRGGAVINYQMARNDMSSPISYQAWLSNEQTYIIMEHDRTDSADTTMKYFEAKISDEAFQDAWDRRAGITFIEYNELFP